MTQPINEYARCEWWRWDGCASTTGRCEWPACPPDMWYLMRCLQCDEDADDELIMPFGSARERGQWATAHTQATGHRRWWVHDQPRTNPHTTKVEGATLEP